MPSTADEISSPELSDDQIAGLFQNASPPSLTDDQIGKLFQDASQPSVSDDEIANLFKEASTPPIQEPELIPPPNTGRMSLARFKKRGELSEERVKNELGRQNMPTGQDFGALDAMYPNVSGLLPQGVKDAALMGAASGVGDAISQVGGIVGAAGAAAKDITSGNAKWQDYLLAAPAAFIPGVYDKAGKILTQFGEKLSAKYNPKEIGNEGGAVTEFVHGATSTGVASLPAMALGWAGGLPAAISGGALQSFGAAFNTAKKTYMERDNLPEDEAAQKALVPAIGEGLATAAVMTIFGKTGSLRFLKLRDAPHRVDLTVRSAIKEVLHGGIGEGFEELFEQAAQSYVAFKTYRPDMTLGDAVMESIQAGVYGAVLGGVVNAGVSGGRLTIQKMAASTPDTGLDPELQQLVKEGSARTEATPPPLPSEPVKQVTEEQFTQAIQRQNQEREKVNEKDVRAIAENQLDKLEQLDLQGRLNPLQDQKRKMIRAMLTNQTSATEPNLAVMLDLEYDPNETKFPSQYRLVENKAPSVVTGKPTGDTVTVPPGFPYPQPKGGEVSGQTKTGSQTQEEKGVEPPAVRKQEVIPVPVAPTPQPVTASGSFNIRFTPVVKALSKVVEALNPSLKTASISKIQVNNAQAESVVAPEPGVVTVNPQKLFEETKGMTEAAGAKHIEGLIKAQTEQFTDPDAGPRYAAPNYRTGYWIDSDGHMTPVSMFEHSYVAERIIKTKNGAFDGSKGVPDYQLDKLGYAKAVFDAKSNTLLVEKSRELTNKQKQALKDYGIENGINVFFGKDTSITPGGLREEIHTADQSMYAASSDTISKSSIADGTSLLNEALGTGTLPAKISIIHDPNLPWAGKFENGAVVINMAWTSDPVATLLHEGLHGIIEAIKTGTIVDAELKAALEEFAAKVTEADTEAEKARRQELDLRDRVIAEEALVAKVLESSPSLLTRVYNAIRKAFKKVFGVDLPADQQTRILDAAKAWLVNENTGQTGEKRFSYARTATEAQEQMAVVKTVSDQGVQAHHNLAQAYDLTELLNQHGVGAISPRSQEMLEFQELAGIANVGTQNNYGMAYGYRQAKHTATPGEQKMLARIAHSALVRFRDKILDRLVKVRDRAAKQMTGAGTVRLQLREAIARAKKDTAELNLRVGASIFNSAYELAVKALKYEAKTDRQIAELEGRLKGISDASKSPQAIRQLLEDIVNVLGSTPAGLAMLSNVSGVQPGVTARDLVSEYIQIKSAAGLPLHDRNLINWAGTILIKSRDVREKLLAQYLASQAPVRAAMSAYQQQVLNDLETNPVGTVKRALRDRQIMTTAHERAVFAWHKLNSELTERMERFQELDDAVTVGQAVVSDPAFDSLFKETAADVGRQGGSKTLLFRSETFLTPSGVEVNIDPQIMVGSKTLWAQTRATLETAQQELQLWLQNNIGHEDYGMHQKNLELLSDYYMGLGTLQPNDTLGTMKAVKKTFDILWNAVERGGGRVAAALKRTVAEFEDTKLKANWWNQKWTGLLGEAARKAFLSHDETSQWGSYGQKTQTDVNNEWWVKAGSQLAYSHNRQADPLQVGDRIGSGWEVTQADLDYLYLQADAASAGFAILGDSQSTKDTLAGVIVYRKGLKGGRGTVPRMFNNDLRDQFAKPFSEAYRAMQLAIRNGDQNAANAARQKMVQLADQVFGIIGFSMVWDRSTEFSQATSMDGPGGAFDLVSQLMSQGQPVSSMAELADALSQNSMLTPDEALTETIGEWGRMVDNWYQAAKVEDSPEAPRAEETANSFTRPRLDALAPYAFYQYGFKTGHSVATFAAGIYSESIDKVAAGLKALIADLRRQQSERKVKIQAGRSQSYVDQQNTLARDAADTYDSYKDLERRIRYAEDIYALLVNDRSDTDVDIQLARHIGALTGALISGTTTTLRNITTGPLYLGQFSRKLSGSNLYGFGSGMYYSWIDAQARILAAVGFSLGKAVVWDLPGGFFKAVGNLGTKEGWRPTRAWNTLMRGVIQEIGDKSYDRIKGVREMRARGIHFIPNQVVDFDNRLLGSMIGQGRLVEEDPTTFRKATLGFISVYEATIAPIYKALAPTFGDTALNLANYSLMMSSMGPVQKLDQRLRSLFMDYQDMGLTVDDLKDRLYTHTEIFPRFQGFRISSSANDMKNVRQAFDLAGMNFDEKANEFLTQLFGGNGTAQFLTDQERDSLANAAINFSNRATGANNPLNLNKKTFLNNLISPFMFWKSRQLSNFMNEMSVPVVSGRPAKNTAELHQKRAIAWAMMMGTILIPYMLAGIAVSSGDEWEARQWKKLLYNQVNATRYFWERDTLKSKWIGAFVASLNGVPFLDMAVNAAFNDLPNRASLDPSLAVIEKGKDLVRYLGGVVQTGDIGYKLPELIGSILPDTKIVLNRLESQSGRREANNVVALLRRNAPVDMLRPSYAGGAGVNVTPYAPIIQRMENAAVRGDDGDFQNAYSEAVQRARSDGKPNPEGYVAQLFGARSAFNRALSGKMTQDQYDTFVSKLSPGDQANLAQYQSRFQAAAASIGSPASFIKEDPSSSGGGTGVRTTGRTVGLASGTGRTRRLGRTRRIGRSIRSRRVGTRRRTGFRSRTRRF